MMEKIKCKDCPYLEECYDAQVYGFCPKIDYGPDIGSATVEEMRLQNELPSALLKNKDR